MQLKCPACNNEDVGLMDTYGHRREQMSCYCKVCGKSWVEIFQGIPKENFIYPRSPLTKKVVKDGQVGPVQDPSGVD